MAFNLPQLLGIGFVYLSVLFASAYITEKGLIPAKVIRHPLTYILSLGVYTSAWAIYGAVGFAYQYGYNFLAYYLGLSGAFLLGPILLAPVLRLAQTYQLSSLADLFAFRYRSQFAGSLVTLFMIMGVLPILTLQIQSIADAVYILNKDSTPNTFAFMFVVIIIVFTILFGARHITAREKHEGLVVAIAVESILKLLTLLIVAGFGLFFVFDGPESIELWLSEHPHALSRLYGPITDGPWRSLILAFFVSAVTMPHMYHMTFTENLNPRNLLTASWGVPIFLFLMALCIPIILWAGIKSNAPTIPDYFTLGIGISAENPMLVTLAFMGGMSAASGVMIVTTIALAAMTLNHLVLPFYQPKAEQNLYSWLLWMRRSLIAIILLFSYGFYRLGSGSTDLAELGILSFVATLQFMPGLLGVIFWPSATRKGFVWGLIVGFTIWLLGMLLPLLASIESLGLSMFDLGFTPSVENWQVPALIATSLNAIVFAFVSYFTTASVAERRAAEACSIGSLRKPYRWELSVGSVKEIINRLTIPLGHATAKREVELALNDLAMSPEESRPYALRRLRDQLETNLSGLLGPAVAQEIVDNSLPYKTQSEKSTTEDIHFIESRIEEYKDKLTGLAAELDGLRRFHRQTLHDLPIGVCSLGIDNEVVSWNHAMEMLTNITASQVLGSSLSNLSQPWRNLLEGFIAESESQFQQRQIDIRGEPRWLSLHKAAIRQESDQQAGAGLAIVIEDFTDVKLLEAKLTHSERLASVGRLAAGVAHEIGNPITGIDCLAQELKAEGTNEEQKEVAGQILSLTDRVTRIVQSLVSFSHSGNHTQHENSEVKLADSIIEAINLIKLSPEAKDLEIALEGDQNLWVVGDAQRLQQVFINLLSNARDASPPNGKITINLRAIAQSVTVEVTDQGTGIPKDIQEKIFEPFVTTKDPGKGTGLGLALVYSIIEDHYGNISIMSPLDDRTPGTRVTITLPRCYP